jgi:Cu(I)/Ag(I) efflux system membrane fusion protein
MIKVKSSRIFLLLILLPLLWVSACSNPQEKEVSGQQEQTFTCPMHPQIVQHKMGTCPICGMDLVPFSRNSGESALTLDERQQALANITSVSLGSGSFANFKQLNGRLVVNPERTTTVSSRVSGRIETLFIKETGIAIQKGQALYKIYSEQLASLQKEYLLTLEQVRQFPDDQVFKQLYLAARQKLELYGETAPQIKQLENAKNPDPFVTYYANSNGIIAELNVTEGQYVSEGSPLMRLESYNNLWIEADVYPAEAAMIMEGQQVKVIIAGWENEPQEVRLSFINPSFQAGSQLMQVRGTLENKNNRWQPGLQAIILLPSDSQSGAFNLPVNAVIRDSQGAHVWLETAKGKFEPRQVKTGVENFDQVEISEGLQSGDKVVTTGAYLLYSEYILKKGQDPFKHQH